MDFRTVINADLPPLAWHLRLSESTALVEHGSRVEVGDGWAVEGVWDGPFEEARFNDTEAFWGSGVRVHQRGVEVVPSVALTDRIFVGRSKTGWFASNSLPLLLGYDGLRLHHDHSYMPESFAMRDGVLRYDPSFLVEGNASVYQIIHASAILEPNGLTRRTRSAVQTFTNFDDYHGALQETISGVSANLRSDRRRYPMLPLATASSGYDSACAAVFARYAGARTVFTSPRSNSSMPALLHPSATNDSGHAIARALGMETSLLPPIPSEREIYFRCASCVRPEVVLDGIANGLNGFVGVVFTGFYGDTLWDRLDAGSDTELVWANPSGVSVSEGRLACGFINLALPFLFGRSLPALRSISRSPEMKPWSIGGIYDRPIARRILEDAGVPRDTFGRRKKAIVDSHASPLNPHVRDAFLDWVARTKRVSPMAYAVRERCTSALFGIWAPMQIAAQHLGWSGARTAPEQLWPRKFRPDVLMFQWAVSTLSGRYSERRDTR